MMRNEDFEASLGGFGSALLDEDPNLSKLFYKLGLGSRVWSGAEGSRQGNGAELCRKETAEASRHGCSEMLHVQKSLQTL